MSKIKEIFLFALLFVLGSFVLVSQNAEAGKGTPDCDVTIELETSPEDGTTATFIPTPGDEFILSDGAEESLLIPFGGALQVTEIVPEGWTIDSIDCSPTDLDLVILNDGIFVNDCNGGNVFCTFENRQIARPIPAISQWGLIAAAAVLGIVGVVFYTRKRAAA